VVVFLTTIVTARAPAIGVARIHGTTSCDDDLLLTVVFEPSRPPPPPLPPPAEAKASSARQSERRGNEEDEMGCAWLISVGESEAFDVDVTAVASACTPSS